MIHKTTRSILSVLLAVLLLVTSIPLTPAFADGGAVSLQSKSGEGLFAGGTGTADDPYQIATAEELWDFAELVNGGETTANAVLTADIDLNPDMKIDEDGKVTNGDELDQWTPIGTSSGYSGTFDGNGHTISGLYIDSDDNDQGLFGYVSGSGKIEKLSVSGSVSGGMYVGGVVRLNNGSVEDCDFTGSVSGSYVGGVVGVNGGNVINCTNTGTVTGTRTDVYVSYVGGVVGYNHSSVTNCYNTGTVTGPESGNNNRVGGVVGRNDGSVKNCYNTGTVTGTDDSVGGVVGYNSSDANVTNCYNTGKVSGSADSSNVGGVVGYNYSGGSVTGCYFLQTDGVPANGIGGGETDGQTATSVTTLGELCDALKGDTTTWTISPFYKHPVLQANPEGGLGTAAHPYEIKTAAQLETFRDLVNGENGQVKDSDAHAKLMNNIDLSSVCSKEKGNWTPIGSFSNSYKGTFDGNGKTISGLYIGTTANNQGLFGYVGTGGTVKDLTVSGTVTGTGDYVGGVVGYNNGTVENCYNTGSVSGFDSVGGVAGWNDGSVKNCYNTGKVSGGAGVGGVVGYNSSTVENCYNIGEVSGSPVGGVVGYNDGDSVTNCYFLQRTAESGIGKNEGSGVATATEKDRATFHSGEVAYLLQGKQTTPVWGQSNLTEEDSWPTLIALDKNAKTVYQVTFDYGDLFTDIDERFAYSYTNGVVSKPDKNPELDGHTLSGWYSDESLTTAWDFSTAVTKNMTLYAKWTAIEEPEPEPEEPPYSGKYSYEIATDIGDNGALSVDRYATEGDEVTITVTPDEAYKLDELVVTANGKDVELTANSDGTYTFTMPSADVRITATFAEDPDWTEPEEPATDVSDLFIDIAPDAWYKDAVQYAYDNGLMTGVSATEFAPEQTTTRAMIVSILARLEGVTTAQAAGFADVDDNDWYATAVNWAANVGVVNGYEDNTFQPNTAIPREQLAAILMNYAAYKGEDVSARADLTSYTDQPSTWATETMSWAVAEGLISGVTNTELQPQGNATRAQVAAILQRFLSE